MKLHKTIFATLTVVFSACFISCSQSKERPTSVESADTKNRIEVIYFHGNMRCPTCRAIEKYANETVDSMFADELKSGTVRFRAINISDNEAMADNYQATGSSLIISSFVNGKESRIDMTGYGFKTARRHHELFQDSLSSIIRSSLKGIRQ